MQEKEAKQDVDELLTMELIKTRLSTDLKAAAIEMTANEARFLVDAYYIHQANRIRLKNQSRSLGKVEPHKLIDFLGANSERIEKILASVLKVYAKNTEVGKWCMSITGIGPVITAGLLAHIDIAKAPTAGHIWSYAGLLPKIVWLGKKQVDPFLADLGITSKTVTIEQIHQVAEEMNRRPQTIIDAMRSYGDKEKFTLANLKRAIKRRPFNQNLKDLCWKIGESFKRNSFRPNCVYGHIYVGRKRYEEKNNQEKKYQKQAEESLATKNYSKSTEAYKWYSQGMLPPARLDLRAMRYATKLFLAHLHWVWFEIYYEQPAPKPYIITHGKFEHAHIIEPVGYTPLATQNKQKK